jgi:hypothetical protein
MTQLWNSPLMSKQAVDNFIYRKWRSSKLSFDEISVQQLDCERERDLHVTRRLAVCVRFTWNSSHLSLSLSLFFSRRDVPSLGMLHLSGAIYVTNSGEISAMCVMCLSHLALRRNSRFSLFSLSLSVILCTCACSTLVVVSVFCNNLIITQLCVHSN